MSEKSSTSGSETTVQDLSSRQMDQDSSEEEQEESEIEGPAPPKDLSDLLEDEDFCDVTFDVDDPTVEPGERQVQCHKAVLNIRCKQLLDMIREYNMKDGAVEIEGTSERAFKTFIKFLYSGRVEMKDATDINTIDQLRDLAIRFSVPKLHPICDELVNVWADVASSSEVTNYFKTIDSRRMDWGKLYINRELSASNWFKILDTAGDYEDNRIIENTLEWILENPNDARRARDSKLDHSPGWMIRELLRMIGQQKKAAEATTKMKAEVKTQVVSSVELTPGPSASGVISPKRTPAPPVSGVKRPKRTLASSVSGVKPSKRIPAPSASGVKSPKRSRDRPKGKRENKQTKRGKK